VVSLVQDGGRDSPSIRAPYFKPISGWPVLPLRPCLTAHYPHSTRRCRRMQVFVIVWNFFDTALIFLTQPKIPVVWVFLTFIFLNRGITSLGVSIFYSFRSYYISNGLFYIIIVMYHVWQLVMDGPDRGPRSKDRRPRTERSGPLILAFRSGPSITNCHTWYMTIMM